MNNPYSYWPDFPEDTPKEKMSGIFQALEFIANESEKMGLKYTAYIIGMAADIAIIEQTQAENLTYSLPKLEHPSKQ